MRYHVEIVACLGFAVAVRRDVERAIGRVAAQRESERFQFFSPHSFSCSPLYISCSHPQPIIASTLKPTHQNSSEPSTGLLCNRGTTPSLSLPFPLSIFPPSPNQDLTITLPLKGRRTCQIPHPECQDAVLRMEGGGMQGGECSMEGAGFWRPVSGFECRVRIDSHLPGS